MWESRGEEMDATPALDDRQGMQPELRKGNAWRGCANEKPDRYRKVGVGLKDAGHAGKRDGESLNRFRYHELKRDSARSRCSQCWGTTLEGERGLMYSGYVADLSTV
jgi:hypothetical protein